MCDVVIVGGGIVGLSTAMQLLTRAPGVRVVLLEKESRLAQHQTGRNSGVIHSGIYYAPGSLKARFATAGSRAMYDFCRQYGIPVENCGKLIVAVHRDELPRLESLYERGLVNGLAVRKLSADELRQREPHVCGLAAIEVPETGIVDFREVAKVMADLVQQAGGEIRLGVTVRGWHEDGNGVVLETDGPTIRARYAVNCAGLHSDRIARLAGLEPGLKIVPFRGEYYELVPEKCHLVKSLVYPVPNPAFPFLGVHLTRGIDGRVHVGPNAVLSLKREGYRKGDVSGRDALETLTYPGFWKVVARYGRLGMGEMVRSWSKRAFLQRVRAFLPEVTGDDLAPAPSGVRAQALTRDGRLLDDFCILQEGRGIHVLNAPSPAATASLMIGETIAQKILDVAGPLGASTWGVEKI